MYTYTCKCADENYCLKEWITLISNGIITKHSGSSQQTNDYFICRTNFFFLMEI